MFVPLTPVRCLHRAVDVFPDKTGVVCGAERFTWSQFGQRCEKLATALAKEGVQAGDRLLFESDSNGVHIRPVRTQSVFEKYRGIGNPGIPSGKKGINRWLREMRGHTD